jgi:hypothetical protein
MAMLPLLQKGAKRLVELQCLNAGGLMHGTLDLDKREIVQGVDQPEQREGQFCVQ